MTLILVFLMNEIFAGKCTNVYLNNNVIDLFMEYNQNNPTIDYRLLDDYMKLTNDKIRNLEKKVDELFSYIDFSPDGGQKFEETKEHFEQLQKDAT